MDPLLHDLERRFLDAYFEFHPGSALAAGDHRHDRRLEDFSPETMADFCATLDRLGAEADALAGLTPRDQVEREVLAARLHGLTHGYRSFRAWERDPSFHADTLSSQLNTLAIYEFAPPEERLEAVVAKERQVPRFLEVAKDRLQPTAPILRDYGVRGFEGALSLVEKDLPAAFADVGSAALVREHQAARAAASAALREFLAWMKNGLTPGSEDAHRLGPELFASTLLAEEGIDTPIADLERWALEEIEKAREGIAREAARIDPAASPAAIVERINADHPRTGEMIGEAAAIAEQVHSWMRRRDVVTFPSDERVRIAPTPAFMAWSFGSMWTPGPLERRAMPATFYATDADPSWPEERQHEHLTAFSRRGLENLAIHEAYPGHFIQSLCQRRASSPLRQTTWWGVFGEGWAHYCEQMAIEQGFGDGAPEVAIVQLQEALNRLCRFVNCIRLHTRPDWSFADGTRFFVEQAWLAETVARAECERAAFDPFYLRYTLGKKLILDLREECRGKLGAAFDLKRFHDVLLAQGTAPMPLMCKLALLDLG